MDSQDATTAMGCLRLAVNSRVWSPQGGMAGGEFQFLLSLISDPEERNAVCRYHFFEDQKRALLSRLLCRYACAKVLGHCSYQHLEIRRTFGRKPFLKAPRPSSQQADLANFNFNASHEGDWVVLASEPICVCGVDVAAPPEARMGSDHVNLKEDFGEQLSAEEWQEVDMAAAAETRLGRRGVGPPGYGCFQRYWSAKEAFVKARGDGLGFEPLRRAVFRFTPLRAGNAVLHSFAASTHVDGALQTRWKFFQHELGDGHWVTVARGPSCDVMDQNGEFKKTLVRPDSHFSDSEWDAELNRPSPDFEVLPVSALVPEKDAEAFLRACTEVGVG
eukprot:TRINITY_DN107969_c0_g1_i1.p1 TRINITY_DN107969_c0_g1~~TRINITY_DN107969_c0_g1_i1.p1  ORF type:complete len:377 (+),score=74.57 TRINITY_DN107969_c0_g1_i1:137-1132(+)